MNKTRILALLAAACASIIYGLNHLVAKDVMSSYLTPSSFILMRIAGAMILFWIVSLFKPQEKIDRKDFKILIVCAFLGGSFNMLSFFKGLSLSTPINSSLISTLGPVFVLILSATFLKERFTWLRGIGIFIGMMGAASLVLFGVRDTISALNIPLGNAFMLINMIIFSIYIVLIKSLASKYHVFTLMKWLFLMGTIIVLPFGYSDFVKIDWGEISRTSIIGIIFVIVGTTFFTYVFNTYALKTLRASTLSTFSYLQPLIAIGGSVLLEKDEMTPIRYLAAILVVVGVYLVSKPPKEKIL